MAHGKAKDDLVVSLAPAVYCPSSPVGPDTILLRNQGSATASSMDFGTYLLDDMVCIYLSNPFICIFVFVELGALETMGMSFLFTGLCVCVGVCQGRHRLFQAAVE